VREWRVSVCVCGLCPAMSVGNEREEMGFHCAHVEEISLRLVRTQGSNIGLFHIYIYFTLFFYFALVYFTLSDSKGVAGLRRRVR
jgi:hypothetical protein